MNYIAHIKEDKETQTLEKHLLNTAALSKENGRKIGAENLAELIGLLHDLGKYGEDFQNYIRSNNKEAEESEDVVNNRGKIDHSTAGAQYIWNRLQYGSNPKTNSIIELIAVATLSHHSGLIDIIDFNGENHLKRRIDKSEQDTHFLEVSEKLEQHIRNRVNEIIDSGELGKEFLQLCSSIKKTYPLNQIKELALNKNQITLLSNIQFGFLAKSFFSILVDADRYDTASFMDSYYSKYLEKKKNYNWDILIQRVEDHIEKFETRNHIDMRRREISDACKARAEDPVDIYSLTVPTGGGKTLSSLRFALNHAKQNKLERIIYVIPYTSIIEQNAQTVREVLEIENADKGNIVLEHHSNIIPERKDWKHKYEAERWDCPIVFTTSVQFLNSIFGGGTKNIRRFHQLFNAVLIFDEAQTLPVKCAHLFCNALNYLKEVGHTTSVLCTATQPLLNAINVQFGSIDLTPEREIIPNTERLFESMNRVQIKYLKKEGGWDNKSIADFVVGLNEERSVLIICNTKNVASEIFKYLQGLEDIDSYYLSTHLCPSHRKAIIGEMKERLEKIRVGEKSKRFICVSTQLIEAGVDIDFDCVVRCMAGIDSIAQAAGRCNRNGLKEQGNVYVINPREEKIEKLEDIAQGVRSSLRIFDEIKDSDISILSPRIIEKYFKYYFYERASTMLYPIDNPIKTNLVTLLSTNQISIAEYTRTHPSGPPPSFLHQAFKTSGESFSVIDLPTVGVLVPYNKEAKELITRLGDEDALFKKGNLLRELQQFSINLYNYEKDKLERLHALRKDPLTDILILDEQFYDEKLGLDFSKKKELENYTI